MISNVYTGHYDEVEWYIVKKNDENFDPAPSLALRNHSPDGFAWGYCGSGPAQLSLAIILEETGNPDLAQEFYQDFKREIIADLPNDDFSKDTLWVLSSQDIKTALHNIIDRHIRNLQEKSSDDTYCGEYVADVIHKYNNWIKEIWK